MTTSFLTDQYELTMLDAAIKSGIAHKQAVFSAFTRSIPSTRRYGVFAGMGRVIEAIKNFTFTPEQINHLRTLNIVSEETLEYLKNYRFTGNISGYREGETYFPHSPLLTVEGTFGSCVLLETVILSIINHDSAVAAAASRMTNAAEGRSIIEMGSRRTHEEAAVSAARAAYIAGFDATSNLEAGIRYGIPTKGTSAHAFTLAHTCEKEAFTAQVATLGVSTTLLVDTYDTPQGIRNAVEVAGPELGGIRIDSGDLRVEVTEARKLLDSLGAYNTKIVVSSDLDEYLIDDMLDFNAPVDAFGAGTRVVTGSGFPTCGMVYKLVAIEDNEGNMIPVTKKASGKKSVGGAKRAFRIQKDGFDCAELVTTDMDFVPSDSYRTLEVDYFVQGENVFNPDLPTIRDFYADAMTALADVDKQITARDSELRITTINEKGEKL